VFTQVRPPPPTEATLKVEREIDERVAALKRVDLARTR